MRRLKPKVFIVAYTMMSEKGVASYLDHLGTRWKSTALTHIEWLVEFMGRLCYRSWEPGMNANVTKVRSDNEEYLANIISSGHGSVLEHASISVVFADVSRVFTHELVRHRVGTAFSQESLRYVRLTDLGLWLPDCIQQSPALVSLFETHFKSAEQLQLALAQVMELDTLPFEKKKELTSAMRRVAPEGLATTIGFTANLRTWRHIIEMRTSRHAEEEIRRVFQETAQKIADLVPALFADYTVNEHGEWVTAHRKV